MAEILIVSTNPKARHDYHIEETFEAGMVLQGTEVKALRERRVNLRDSFGRIQGEEIFLHNCHISPYSHGNITNHDPLRTRKLLLHHREINKLIGKTQQRGYTLVALKIYFKRGRAKIELGLGRGKKAVDKRETIKARMAKREMDRALKGASRG